MNKSLLGLAGMVFFVPSLDSCTDNRDKREVISASRILFDEEETAIGIEKFTAIRNGYIGLYLVGPQYKETTSFDRSYPNHRSSDTYIYISKEVAEELYRAFGREEEFVMSTKSSRGVEEFFKNPSPIIMNFKKQREVNRSYMDFITGASVR